MSGGDWVPENGSVEEDLRSRLACVLEATYWDRPYDERIAAIRGMCDLTTNGLTPNAGPPTWIKEVLEAPETADAFRRGWETADALGQAGARVSAGLAEVMAVIEERAR